ncbi:enoyl-CoA hydratase [Shewanella sp. C32]|uniref:Enoyl-CoA hydratase n=1 Tax=Shewanella electrica TaxID=515560 RepID=A0ABT2FJR5_9GAMM|nr:enoyl-CoA hydratase [Shewanella electrica]MCH1923354.1 enoyl-CoA hydratase [Shewanella electrica]MCS4555451.1 enoyl-CoA hydratase [Shewanella electrica]
MSGLRCEIVDHCAVITIDNPPANTWTAASLQQLAEYVDTLEQDGSIYSLIITGAGTKFFSAGAELRLFADGDKGTANAMANAFGAAFERLSAFSGVSIAAINGYAMGGGLEVALACDIRIVEQHAQLALPEASVGLLPCAGGTQNLTALVGEGWAKRMILLGERVTAQQAVHIGLAESLVESGAGLHSAQVMAQMVERQSPGSVRACKQLIQAGRTMPRSQALPLERELFVALFDSADQREGVSAFLEKRPAQWQNS